jgi:hypothetical protein
MKNMLSVNNVVMVDKGQFNPFKIVSDEEFCRNMNSVLAYYQISKGERKQRFTSSASAKRPNLVQI